MDNITKQKVQPLRRAFWEMNNTINDFGEIKPSSRIIKQWHKYDNLDWACIVDIVRLLEEQGAISLKNYTIEDLDWFETLLTQYHNLGDNVLYPDPKTTAHLPDAITHANRAKHKKSTKTKVFRSMMNIREALCKACGIDLPNDDSSKGKLDPTPFDNLFN